MNCCKLCNGSFYLEKVMKKIVGKLKDVTWLMLLLVVIALLTAGVIASLSIVLIAIKLAWFGVTL